MQYTTEQQLQKVLSVIAEYYKEHPNTFTPDTYISRELGIPTEDVRAYMDELVGRGMTTESNARDGHAAMLTGKGRIALKDPSLLNSTPATTVPPHGAIFDQRGQYVNYQYNAARDINFQAVQNTIDFVTELTKLKAEIRKAGDANVIEGEIVDDAEHQVSKAITEAKQQKPDKKKLVDHLTTAKNVVVATSATVAAVPELVDGFQKAIDAIQKLPF